MNLNYGSISTSGSTFVLAPASEGERPKKPTQGLIATQAVQTAAGWLGQVFVDRKIVFESAEPHDDADTAIDEANAKVVDTVSRLFTGPAT